MAITVVNYKVKTIQDNNNGTQWPELPYVPAPILEHEINWEVCDPEFVALEILHEDSNHYAVWWKEIGSGKEHHLTKNSDEYLVYNNFSSVISEYLEEEE